MSPSGDTSQKMLVGPSRSTATPPPNSPMSRAAPLMVPNTPNHFGRSDGVVTSLRMVAGKAFRKPPTRLPQE